MALGSGRKIVVEFIGDASALRRGTRDGEAALQGFSGKAQAAGRIAGKALAGGLILAGGAAIYATKAAAEDEAAQSQLAQQLKQAAGATDEQIASTEEWITAQGKATGLSDDELRPALARLATATGDVGEAQRLAALAMDVSAGSGKSYQQVTEALAKAQNGNIGALGRLGIATKDADGKTKSLAQIQKDLAGKYMGAAAKAAETSAGKQKILTTQFGELQEQIGAKLLPAMVSLANIGLKIVSWVSDNTKVVGVFVAALGSLLAVVWAVGAATKAWAAITAVWSAVTKIATATQWLLNVALTANPIGLVVVAIAALVVALVIAYKKSETFRKVVQAAMEGVKVAVGAVANAFMALVRWIAGVPARVSNGLSSLKATIRNVFDAAMTAGLEKVKNIGGTIKDWIAGIPGKLLEKVANFKAAGKALIGAVVDGMKNAAGVIGGIADNVWGAVKTMLNAAIDKINAALEFTIELPGPNITVNPPNIPHLAKGGIVSKPTLALIGEDGPEAVVPLGAKNAPKGRLNLGGGGGAPVVININGALDPNAVARQVEQILTQYRRNQGRPLTFAY